MASSVSASELSLEHIRKTYDVPANAGQLIEFENGELRKGEIIGGVGSYLKVMLEGDTLAVTLHPTWNVTYCQD